MRKWMWLAALILAAAALILTGLAVARGAWGLIGAMSPQAGEPDPMFAEPPERVTRPPEPSENAASAVDGDNSTNWTYRTLTPLEP